MQYRPQIGIVGVGAFGELIVTHLRPWFDFLAFDAYRQRPIDSVTFADLPSVASCKLVIVATPVDQMSVVLSTMAPHLKPGSLIMDVGSVKVRPAELMRTIIPYGVDIVATHPLFGPQSACDGLDGLKIALCPIRGSSLPRLKTFLERRLRLNVIVTTPERHDREVAMSQALVHLIAKVLVQMEPLPKDMTTRSFDLLVKAIDMVRNDAPSVFAAIEKANPYSADVRRRFFSLAKDLEETLHNSE